MYVVNTYPVHANPDGFHLRIIVLLVSDHHSTHSPAGIYGAPKYVSLLLREFGDELHVCSSMVALEMFTVILPSRILVLCF